MMAQRMEGSRRTDRSRLAFMAGAAALVVTVAVGHRASAQAGPAGRVTVYKEPT